MELNLKKGCLNCYQAALDMTLTQEETAETIVPDYCPDIARIIDTIGKVYLHSRELRDGKAEVSGTVKVTVLYTPDGENGIRTLCFALPFTAQAEGKCSCASLFAETQVELIESRMLNPRKIFTRCKLVTQLLGYRKDACNYCSDAEPMEAELGVEKQQEQQCANVITHIVEKDFTFNDELTLSSTKEKIEELLLSRVRPTVSETKIVGNKLILKGIFALSLLCRTASSQYSVVTGELPFSQILEIEDTAESAVATVSLQLTGTDLTLSPEDGRCFSVTLYCRAQAILREDLTLTLLRDLYSTAYDLSYEAVPLTLTECTSGLQKRQMMRELLEIGVVVKSILSMDVVCGPVSVSREGESATLRTMAELRVLYQDEGDVPLISDRRLEVSCQMELPAESQISAQASCCEEVQGSIGSGGIELRFPVDFIAQASTTRPRSCILSAKVDTEKPKDFTGMPSLVLRCLDQKESLWSLAKRYSTTMQNILSANELEDSVPNDVLLLIPRKRT